MSVHRILPAGAVLSPMPGPVAAALCNDTPGGRGTPKNATTKPQTRSRRIQPRRDQQPPDRFRVLNNFVDGPMRRVSDGAVKAWFILYRDTKPDGLAKTGLSDMATRMGSSVSTAKRAVRDLRKSGLVTLVQKGAPGRGPNVYRVHGTPTSDVPRGGDEPDPN